MELRSTYHLTRCPDDCPERGLAPFIRMAGVLDIKRSICKIGKAVDGYLCPMRQGPECPYVEKKYEFPPPLYWKNGGLVDLPSYEPTLKPCPICGQGHALQITYEVGRSRKHTPNPLRYRPRHEGDEIKCRFCKHQFVFQPDGWHVGRYVEKSELEEGE